MEKRISKSSDKTLVKNVEEKKSFLKRTFITYVHMQLPGEVVIPGTNVIITMYYLLFSAKNCVFLENQCSYLFSAYIHNSSILSQNRQFYPILYSKIIFKIITSTLRNAVNIFLRQCRQQWMIIRKSVLGSKGSKELSFLPN
jgi:hypothetical protein